MSGIDGGALPPAPPPGSGRGQGAGSQAAGGRSTANPTPGQGSPGGTGAGQPVTTQSPASAPSGSQAAAQQGAAQQAQTQSQNQGAQAAASQKVAQNSRSARTDSSRPDSARAESGQAAQAARGGSPPPPPVRAEGLAQLIAQGTNRATVVGQDGGGQPIVRTGSGVYLLADGPKVGQAGPALGQEVLLRLVPTPATARGGVTFALLPGGAAQNAGAAMALVRPEALTPEALARFGLAGSGTAGTPAIAAGHRLGATFLAPAAGGTGSWPAGQGFAAMVRVIGQNAAASGPATVPGAPAGGTPQAGTVPAAALPGSAAAAAAPGAAAPAAVDPSGALVLNGRVLGPGPSGGTLVQTSAGTFLLQTGQPWSGGLTVTMSLTPADALPTMPMAAAQALGRDWPALDAAMAQLAAQQPGLATALRSGPIPGPNSGFTAAFIAFLSALRGGGLQGWLGPEAGRSLERGPHGAQLADDLAFFSMLLDDRLDGDWRMLALPYADGEKLRQLTVYMRDRRKKQEEGDPGSRFVVALDLSTTGAMQIDGLVRQKRLDLALRTDRLVPKAWQSDIQGIFEEALAITGMTGRLVFQHGREALLDLPQPGAAERTISA